MTEVQATRLSPATVFPRLSVSILTVVVAIFGQLWPFALVNGAGHHDNQRILEVFCVVLAALFGAAVLLLSRRERIRRLYNKPVMLFLMLFFALGFVSSVLAYSSRHALFEWANFLLLPSMSMLIAAEISARGDALLDKILLFCGLGCAFYIFLNVLIYIAVINTGNQPSIPTFIIGFDNYRFFNHVQTITLPLLCLFTCRSNDARRRIFGWIVASAWWTLLFVSAGRGTFIGMIAGTVIAWICLRKEALPWCQVMLKAAFAGFVVYLVFYVLIPMASGLMPFGLFFELGARTTLDPGFGRMALWRSAWKMIVEHPWLGVGPLHYAHFSRAIQSGAHPHDWVLQIASEWGIPALLCLVAAIGLSFRKLLQARKYLVHDDAKNHILLAAWLTIGVAILVDGLVSGLIVMPSSQLWIALYIGCAWGWRISVTPVRDRAVMRIPTLARISGVACMLACMYFLGNGLWPEIRNLPAFEEQNLQKDLYPDPMLRPRTWLGGFF